MEIKLIQTDDTGDIQADQIERNVPQLYLVTKDNAHAYLIMLPTVARDFGEEHAGVGVTMRLATSFEVLAFMTGAKGI